MDNNFKDVISKIKNILGMDEKKLNKFYKFYEEGGFWISVDDELVVGVLAYEDELLTIPKNDGEYLIEYGETEVVVTIKDGVITDIQPKPEEPEEPETPETPETELDEKDIMIEKLTKDIELLIAENDKLKKICEDNEIDITNLKSDIEKFKKTEFQLKKEIEKLGKEPEVPSLNNIKLNSENKVDFNSNINFLKSIY